MKFLNNYLLAILVLLTFVSFGFTSTARANEGEDDSNTSGEVEDSGNDSASDLDDSDEDTSSDDSSSDTEDDSNPRDWKDKPHFPMLKKVGEERPGLFGNMIENKTRIEDNKVEFKGELKTRTGEKGGVAEARMRVGARIEAHMGNFENLKERILSRVEKMEAAGIDTSVIVSSVSTLEIKLQAAMDAHQEMKSLFESDTADKSSVEAAANEIKSAMTEVHDAFKAVIDAMKAAITASGGVEAVS